MFVAGMLLTEVIGGRLFTTVRDALGLTYDCNFQLAFGLQNSDATTFRLVVTSTPAKIDDALAAALRVLRGFRAQRGRSGRWSAARMTLLTRHETELKTNAYWVDLMQYTALGEVLAPAKDVSCIADLPAMYEAATVEDLYEVYQQLGLDDGEVFTCVTVAGKEDPRWRRRRRRPPRRARRRRRRRRLGRPSARATRACARRRRRRRAWGWR